MKIRSAKIALAGIGAAFSLLFVILSYYLEMLSVSLNVIASFGIILPLSQKYYREALLSCIAVSILAFIIVNIGAVPFIMVGSFYIVFTIFSENKKYSYYKTLPIKLAYSLLVFFILYQIVAYISIDITQITVLQGVNKTALYIIFNLIFSSLFVAYDLLIIHFYRYFKDRIVSKLFK